MDFFYKLFFTRLLDFEVLYRTTTDLFFGKNPYINTEIFTGLGYPPNTLLFYYPFISFNQNTAQVIFSILSLIFLVLCAILSIIIVKKRAKMRVVVLISLSLFIAFPSRHTLLMGQNNFFAYLLLLLSYYFFSKKRALKAGIFLGLAIGLKTIFGFFFLFYLFKKQFKILLYSFLTLLILFGITVLFFGPDLYKYWFEVVLPKLFNFNNREIYNNQGISGFVARLISDVQIRKISTYILSCVLIAFTLLKTQSASWRTKLKTVSEFSLYIITLNLIDSLAWQHHFVWLLLPYVYLIYTVKKPISWIILLLSYALTALGHNFWGAIILYCQYIVESNKINNANKAKRSN